MASRNRGYDSKRKESVRLPAPVLSVGNLTVGGTGKSPLVDCLARLLGGRDRRVGIVSRGYGRRSEGVVVVSDGTSILASSREAGDEPMLLARRNPAACVVVGEDRVEAGRIALNALGCDTLLLDDGFQHRRIRRDLDLLVIDASNPWGNGQLLPGGPLREPLSSFRRAGGVVLSHADRSSPEEELIRVVREYTDAPIFRTYHSPSFWKGLAGEDRQKADILRGRRVVAFSGIGNPESFRRTLETMEIEVAESIVFRDHHWYTRRSLDRILRTAERWGADAVVTTEKDAVRLPEGWYPELPAYALGIDLEFIGGSGAFDGFVAAALANPSEEAHG